MKKYSLLILSFILSIVIFSILVIIQRKITDQDSLIKVYLLNKDIDIYTSIEKEFFDEVYLRKDFLNNYEFITNLDDTINMSSRYSLKKGEILKTNSLISNNEIINEKVNNNYEDIAIKLDSISNIYNQIINEKTSINLYITVDEKNLPYDIQNYSKIVQTKDEKNAVTFIYIKNVIPIKFLDENGNHLDGQNKFSSVILNVTKEQAMYLNSIKDVASFKITIK